MRSEIFQLSHLASAFRFCNSAENPTENDSIFDVEWVKCFRAPSPKAILKCLIKLQGDVYLRVSHYSNWYKLRKMNRLYGYSIYRRETFFLLFLSFWAEPEDQERKRKTFFRSSSWLNDHNIEDKRYTRNMPLRGVFLQPSGNPFCYGRQGSWGEKGAGWKINFDIERRACLVGFVEGREENFHFIQAIWMLAGRSWMKWRAREA